MDNSTAATILGIGLGATSQEVDDAFRARARKAHPDAGGDRARFELLIEARRTLAHGESAPQPSPHPIIIIRDEPWWRRVIDALRRRPAPRAPRVQ